MSVLRHAVVITLFLLVVCGMDVPRVINAVGTYFEVGEIVGYEAKDLIRTRLNRTLPLWQWLLKTPAAQSLNESMFKATNTLFPELVVEMTGIAQGSGLSVAEVFFLNTIAELESLQGSYMGHCTDVFSAGTNLSTSVWGHNEDSGPHDCNLTYIVNATIYNTPKRVVVTEKFVAYTYPGSVAGRAFGWNHHGLIITTNALFANNINTDNPRAIPRAFHNRALYRAKDAVDALTLVTGIPSVTAFSLNLGSWIPPKDNNPLWESAPYHNAEIDPAGTFSYLRVFFRPTMIPKPAPPVTASLHHLYHANNFQVLRGNATIDPSSTARIDRLNQFPVPNTYAEVRNMLGDTKNSSYPVWQHGRAAGFYTMATALFRFDEGKVLIYANNPKTSNVSIIFNRE